MAANLESSQLFKWLKKKNAQLAARVQFVREELTKWLPRIVELFPHYPGHDMEHSDRIVAQLSKLLFRKNSPVISLSTSEAYCLLCAAYLHDMGMVVPHNEISEILASDAWSNFVAEGGKGHDAYTNYRCRRDERGGKHDDEKDYFADIALRELFAEFVRRDHHVRGKLTLQMHPFLRQLVDVGSSVAFETIADIGVGHGLQDSELSNDRRFPEERDVLNEKVNVRFLTRLLRIGDLLDMDEKRADPMTLKAARPLPENARPHWAQYSTKKHENISPDAIEFRFECDDQETHRILRDWFGWLESEVRAAGIEQLHAKRHDNWKAPCCSVGSQATRDSLENAPNATIHILPSADAKYSFHDWRLKIDQERIIERLIHDVYESPTVFIRELIQNALDATRCQMYVDFVRLHPSTPVPDRPTKFDEGFRERYPISITLATEDVQSSPDSTPEPRPVFTIEDFGTGMDEHIIKNYFLQIGRSFYESRDFRERYAFVPTSRFGVGFLSTFAVSDDITVETRCQGEESGVLNGLRLRLRGPRNYLLTEPLERFSQRSVNDLQNGTRIRVVLNELPKESLTELITGWCVATEVPIRVNEFGANTTVRPERWSDADTICESRVELSGRFIIRSFDVRTDNVEGQLAVIAYVDEQGEGWCDCWSRKLGLDGERIDKLPKLVGHYRATHGILYADGNIGASWWENFWFGRIDYRSRHSPNVARTALQHRRLFQFEGNDDTQLQAVARAAVETHLVDASRARGEWGTIYKGKVLSAAPVADEWRDQVEGTVVTWRNGHRVDISGDELLRPNEIVLATWPERYFDSHRANFHPKDAPKPITTVSWSDVPEFCRDRLKQKIHEMRLENVERHENLWLFTFSNSSTGGIFRRIQSNSHSWIGAIPSADALNIEPLGESSNHFTVLNSFTVPIRVAAFKWFWYLDF